MRGPLHGIPIMLKANIDTADRMSTTAGSLALVGVRRTSDSTVAARLRAAGAVILGKTNLSGGPTSAASTRAALERPGRADATLRARPQPLRQQLGQAASVAANLTAAGLGTETDGSIVCPANINGVVGIKPTVGLTSRAGVIRSPTPRTPSPARAHGGRRAAVRSALVGVDPRDPQTAASAGHFSTDYTQFLDPTVSRAPASAS